MISEQQERQNLNKQFRALSDMLPGLQTTEMDEASLLEDCISYIKEMEQRVKELEVVESSRDEFFEVETKVCNRDVLIGIHCENREGILGKFFQEVEKREIRVVNSHVRMLRKSVLAITIVAKMDDDFKMDVKDLVNGLRSAYAA